MEKGIKREFDEIERVYQGGAVPQNENIRNFKNNFKGFVQYCETLSAGQENVNLTNAIMESIKELLNTFVNAEEVCRSNFKSYYMMLRQQECGYKYTGKEQIQIEGEYKKALYEMTMRVKMMLDQSNVIETSLLRERNSLINLGVDRMLPIKSEQDKIHELIDQQFSVKAFVNRSVIESLALNVFWINKLIKYVQANQAGFMLVMNKDTKVSMEEVEKVKEEEKYVALCRLAIITKMYHLFMDSDREEMVGVDFSDYLSKIFLERRDLKEEQVKVQEPIDKERMLGVIERAQKVPKDFVEEFREVEEEYNRLFSEEDTNPEVGQFLNDCMINHNFCTQIKQLYEIKDTLIMDLLLLLQLDHKRVIPNYKNWGIYLDPKKSEGLKARNILFLDLPGYIKPMTVHVVDDLMERSFKDVKFPEYRGAFLRTSKNKDEKYMTTNMLFKVSPEQLEVLKGAYQTRRKKKMGLSPSEKVEFDVIQHMFAMASNDFSKIPIGEENQVR